MTAGSFRGGRQRLVLPRPCLGPVPSLVSEQALLHAVGGTAVAAERFLRHVRGLDVPPQLGGQRVA